MSNVGKLKIVAQTTSHKLIRLVNQSLNDVYTYVKVCAYFELICLTFAVMKQSRLTGS